MAAINLTPGHKYILCTIYAALSTWDGSSWGTGSPLGEEAMG